MTESYQKYLKDRAIRMEITRLERQAKARRYDLVTVNGVKYGIRWEFIPEIPEVRYYPDGSGQPGEPAYPEIYHILDLKTLIPIDECADWSENQWQPFDDALFTIIEQEQKEYWEKIDKEVAELKATGKEEEAEHLLMMAG